MTLKQLQYLKSIIECGSVTKASQKLQVSQPNLTKAIASLEDEYKIRIFERRTHGVQLTQEGREFFYFANGVLSAADTLNNYRDSGPRTKKRLSVATQQLDFIYPLFQDCIQVTSADKVYFDLIETERNDVVRQVLNRKADIGFAVRCSEDTNNFLLNTEASRLEVNVITSGTVFAAIGRQSPYYETDSLKMKDLTRLPQIALDMESEAKEAFWLGQDDYSYFASGCIIFCNTASACEHFLLRNNAVAFTSEWTKGCYRDPSIRILPVDDADSISELIWLKRQDEPLTPTEEYFLALVYQYFQLPVPPELKTL